MRGSWQSKEDACFKKTPTHQPRTQLRTGIIALQWWKRVPWDSPTPGSTEPWERILGGPGQSNVPPLKSAQAGVELRETGLLGSQERWDESLSP
jgi:hypothetical protein